MRRSRRDARTDPGAVSGLSGGRFRAKTPFHAGDHVESPDHLFRPVNYSAKNMKLTEEEIHGLGAALNEATFLGAEVDASRHICGITLAVFSLPPDGPMPEDPRVQILLQPVGRVAASLRHGQWDDAEAEVEPFAIDQLLEVVQSFHGRPIYGWEFFDTPDVEFAKWSRRLSLDWRGDPDGMLHHLTLFQEGGDPERVLDLRIWFRDIQFRRPSGEEIPIGDVIDDGQRWWDGLHSGDPRTQDQGIYPIKNDEGEQGRAADAGDRAPDG